MPTVRFGDFASELQDNETALDALIRSGAAAARYTDEMIATVEQQPDLLAREIAAKMSNAKAVVFDGIGHLVHLEDEARFNAAMLAFLNGPK